MEFINKQPDVFMIAGTARQGKDTVAQIILDYYQLHNKKGINLQLSYYIKEYAKKITDWDGSEASKPRELLQQLGTDLIREQIDQELFIRRVTEDIKVYSYFYDVITISDIRLDMEVIALKDAFPNASFIKVERPGESKLGSLGQHITEQGLQHSEYYDKIIDNNDTLEALNEKVIAIVRGEEVV